MQRKKCRHLRSRGQFERILPVLMILLAWPPAAGIAAAQEAPLVQISATHTVTASVDQGDGTYAVTYQFTLTNESSTDLNAISMAPLPAIRHAFLDLSPPPLDVATLPAGGTTTVSWTATQRFPGEGGLKHLPVSFYGSAADNAGAAITVFAFSTGGAEQ